MLGANNTFQDLGPEETYVLLTDPDNGLPTWPSERDQLSFIPFAGPSAVKQTQHFIDMLDDDGAFTPGWRGLDYGAGSGRIAALRSGGLRTVWIRSWTALPISGGRYACAAREKGDRLTERVP